MNKNTINERKKTDIGTDVQMSKYFNNLASQSNRGPGKWRLENALKHWTSR